MDTVRLTTAQAIVRWLVSQRTVVDGEEVPLFPGVFGIFGHGNVTCLGHALEVAGDDLPTWRGQNEQGMALAAVAFAKAKRRQQIMIATSSVGPGATNMVTAAAVAHANRLPLLLFSGDTFTTRAPDPVLQQVEHFDSPSTTVNDAFRPVVRFWDRITHPAQVVHALPAALTTMLDPASCGPAFIGLPQDVQADAHDYPVRFFDTVVHEAPRPRADVSELDRAAEVLRSAERPVVIAGGGVHYSLAEDTLRGFAEQHGLPVVETVAGKSSLVADHANYVGPVGVTGCDAANNVVAAADVVLAVGCRLQDFTTASWTLFDDDVTIIGANAQRFDAVKHRSVPVVGDARETLVALGERLGAWSTPAAWTAQAAEEKAGFLRYLDAIGSDDATTDSGANSYAQVVRAVNDLATSDDYVVAAAGGLPGELNNGWWSKGVATFDCEYGYSCMGYEISGGWGAAIANHDGPGDTFVFTGDGSYLMMNSDLYAAALAGHKMIVIVCDNAGYAVINRLQINQGGTPFNNLIEDCRSPEPFTVDFAAHAAAMGCRSEWVEDLDGLRSAVDRARAADRTSVICIKVDQYTWTEGGAFWQVGVPEVSEYQSVLDARAELDKGLADQRLGW
ncbi:MAG: 3D-(3,5/4)-trihydroxycyclohexane-1,2-dione acylhydrolase (decyclizing) [Actinomycetota bacterium]